MISVTKINLFFNMSQLVTEYNGVCFHLKELVCKIVEVAMETSKDLITHFKFNYSA